MNLKAWLFLTLGGLIASILLVSSGGSIETINLANRINTLDRAAVLARHLYKIESARRRYQASGASADLSQAEALIAEATGKIDQLKGMAANTGSEIDLVKSLDGSFDRYQELLDAYARSEERKSAAKDTMAVQLNNLQTMAAKIKKEKKRDYHQTFSRANSIQEAEDELRTTLRLTALANELIVAQASIERAVALFQAGDKAGAAGITIEIGRIAEIAYRIRDIEMASAKSEQDDTPSNLPDQIVSRSNQFQAGYDDYRLAAREQDRRAKDMADEADQVIALIQRINALQTEAAVESSNRTLALSLLAVVTALILGVLATIIMRNRIIAPLMAITKTMKHMSDGQLEISVPGHERADELGAMARALEVFRKNSLEARRLAEEQVQFERRLAEEQAEAAFLEQSLAAEKELNSQQRRFVSLVSHEFRTPLAIIDGQAQRLIRKADSLAADKRAIALEKIRKGVQRLTDLMERVLSSSSLEAGSISFSPAPMDLRSLIHEVCAGQQEVCKTHRINVDVRGLPEAYLGDQKLLFQVATNLLSNAVKYSPAADHIEVTGRATDLGLEIAFRDFGVGIPEGELSQISQRFFRASTSTGIQGTGIGLNLVRSLIEMHDGILEITSKEGEGSTFTVKLPHRPPSANSEEAAA